MSGSEKIEELSESVKEYAGTSYELAKLEVMEHVSVIGADLFNTLIIGLTCAFFMFFGSIVVALYISGRTGNNYEGFLVVAAFYLLLSIVLLAIRKKVLEHFLRDRIVRRIFSKPQL